MLLFSSMFTKILCIPGMMLVSCEFKIRDQRGSCVLHNRNHSIFPNPTSTGRLLPAHSLELDRVFSMSQNQ